MSKDTNSPDPEVQELLADIKQTGKEIDSLISNTDTTLRQQLAEIIYGVDEAKKNIKTGVFMPQVEAALEVCQEIAREARLDELNRITKSTIERPETPENQNDRTWQGGYRFAKNSLKRYKLERIKALTLQDTQGGLAHAEETKAQGHEADNSSPLVLIPHRDGYMVHVYEDGRVETDEEA